MSFLFTLHIFCAAFTVHFLLFCCFFPNFWGACTNIMFITSPAHFIPPSSKCSTLPSLTQTSATHQFVAKIVLEIRRVFLVGGKGVLRAGRSKTASLLRLQTHRKMELSVLISGKSSDALCACASEGCVIMHTSLPSAATWAAWSVSSAPEQQAFTSSAPAFTTYLTTVPQIPTPYDSCLCFLYPICSLNSSHH